MTTITEYTLADAVLAAYKAVETGLSRADGEVNNFVLGTTGKVVAYRVGDVIRIDVRQQLGKGCSSDPQNSQV